MVRVGVAELAADVDHDQATGGSGRQIWQNDFKNLGLVLDGSTFKNQGDCIQYVNTGK